MAFKVFLGGEIFPTMAMKLTAFIIKLEIGFFGLGTSDSLMTSEVPLGGKEFPTVASVFKLENNLPMEEANSLLVGLLCVLCLLFCRIVSLVICHMAGWS